MISLSEYLDEPRVSDAPTRVAKPLVHENLIRCPRCLLTREVDDVDEFINAEGHHDVCCDGCGTAFGVTTRVRRVFVSPAP